MESPQRFGAAGFLEYNPQHKVLICRECQYAVQRSACDSHLLKHKIYRGARQDLLSIIAGLPLSDADEVVLPCPTDPPVNGLPVFAGFRCVADAATCQYLSVSSKRMKHHWVEAHGIDAPLPLSSTTESNANTAHISPARAVKLQTFFRGTKVRYFEVDSESGSVSSGAGRGVSASKSGDATKNDLTNERGNLLESRDGEEDQAMADQAEPHRAVVSSIPSSLSSEPAQPPATLRSEAIPTLPSAAFSNNSDSWLDSVHISLLSENADLRGLSYFSHFVSSTCLTLHAIGCIQWTSYTLDYILAHEWLAYGLLALSACHSHQLNYPSNALHHYVSSVRYIELFRKCLRGLDHSELDDEELKLVQCIKLLLRLCTLQYSGYDMPEIGLYNVVSEVRIILFVSPPRPEDEEAAISTHSRTSNAIKKVLDELPSFIAEGLGRPESSDDVLAVISAIEAIDQCHARAHGSSKSRWQYLGDWINKVTRHFYALLARNHPAAIVVLAHWAAISVKEAELDGCWFLDGLSKYIVERTLGMLLRDEHYVLARLVNRLVNAVTARRN